MKLFKRQEKNSLNYQQRFHIGISKTIWDLDNPSCGLY